MKERPILFNTEMVQAILDGRKTQTKRPVKIPAYLIERQSESLVTFEDECGDQQDILTVCTFGKIGDRPWVRETFHIEDSKVVSPWADGGQNRTNEEIFYRADGVELYGAKWRPSIHMPRWASRITLEITDIRVERLKDINEEDVELEGFSGGLGHFTDTWIGIYGRESLDKNPWVWVVEFKVVNP